MKPADKTPEQVWQDYVIAVAKLNQVKAVNVNLRRLRARAKVDVIKLWGAK
jgi:hypothetical protein